MSQMFQYDRSQTHYTVDAPDIKRNTCRKIFPFSLHFLGVKNHYMIQHMCTAYLARMVTILYIETFMTFDFDPSLI